MCRHKGIGMNRPKKKKLGMPELLTVKLLLRGRAVDLSPELEPAPEPTQPARAPPSPGRLVVLRKQRVAAFAKAHAQVAEEVLREGNTAWKRACALHKARCWALEHARKSKKQSVLDKRVCKSYQSDIDIKDAEIQLYYLMLQAEQYNCVAETARADAEKAAKERLMRKMRDAKKSELALAGMRAA